MSESPFESGKSLAQLVLDQASESPASVAVEDGERRLTYGDLDLASAAIARALLAAGVEEGEPVAVSLPRSWQAICAFLGVVRAGAAYLPVNPSYPSLRKRSLLELAGVRTGLSSAAHGQGLPGAINWLDASRPAELGAGEPPPCAPGGDRLAYVLFTSGSTGEPKGVEITHANLVHVFGSHNDLVPAAGDTVLGVAPIEFDIAALEIWGALTVGARLVLVPAGRPDPRAIARLIADRGITFAFFAAGLFEQVVRVGRKDLGNMRLIAAGGDVMSPAAARLLRAAHPQVRLLNGYGPTETSIVASFHEVDEVDGSPLPIGLPLPGYAFHVLDESGAPVRRGEAGELWIGGPGVGRGYLGDPERTRDRFREGHLAGDGSRLYRSGDTVRQREDGEYLFLGRADDQVKIAGYRIEPGEVEQVLGTHPGVGHAAVVAREDVAGHKRLVGYASLADGATVGERDLRGYLAERLPAYMVPASIQVLAELPLTSRGKVDRAALPTPQRAGGAAAADPAVQQVAELMAELLRIEEMGPDEDFFVLGADSLLALQLTGRLRNRFDSELAIGVVFDAPTPRTLAAALADGPAIQRAPLRPRGSRAPAPLSFAQRRAWLFERANPDSLAFQFAAIVHFRGPLDEAALAGALGDLLRRHEVLRTGLVEGEGEPVQVVEEDVPLPLEVIDLAGRADPAWPRLVRERVRTKIDIRQAPMVRWTLVRFGPERAALIDVEHHAVHDGWSFGIVLTELAELYSARVEERAPALPALELTFGDFAAWERDLAGSPLAASQLEYWRRTLDPDPALLDLPVDRPRPHRESFCGGSVRRRFDPALADGVAKLAREEGATSFMVCLAAFASLLGRYGESADVQVGSGLANRRDPAAEQLVGMTVGTVALRIDLSGDPSVRELLRRARATVLGAMSNADVPFEQVVEDVAPTRQPGRSPLIQALFSFDDAPMASPSFAGLEAEVVQTIPNGTAKADLNVIGVDHGDGSPFFIWEHSDLFSDATADRLAGQHLRVLEQFVRAPETRLSQLELQGAEERAQIAAWRQAERGHDAGASLIDLVLRQARRQPDATAIVAGAERLSYGDLIDRASAVAGWLRASGIGPGEPVGVLLPRSADSVVAQLGALMAGGSYLPLDPGHPRPRMEKALADAGARFVLTGAGEDLPAGVEGVDIRLAIAAEPIEPAWPSPDALAYVMYTSGSTGEPKGVEVTHGNVVRLVDDPDFAELGPGTVMLHAASPAFDATTLEVWGPLANGGTVVTLSDQPAPDSVAAAVAAHGVNTMWLTAGLFHELVDRRPECLGGLRHLLAGGDVLSAEHVRGALLALPPGARLSNGYGPTETTTFALVHHLRPGDEVPDPVPLGRPIQSTTCDVLDPEGRPLPIGKSGELWIGGDGVARGYRNDPELSAERFTADPHRPGKRRYRTGDRVRRLADGTIEFLGRLDRQVKVRGIRVEPAEIEAILRTHAGVADIAVVPYAHSAGEQALAAYVVPAGADPPGPGALREHAKRLLPAAMVPSAWVPLPRLPLTINGKLDHSLLPAPGHEHLATNGGGPAATDTERRVVRAFETVLGISPVGVEDDFFALGGHSLLAVSLFEELERIGGTRLPLATVFEESTPRGLAARLGRATPAASWDNLVPLKPNGSGPPIFVVSTGDGNLVGFAPLARHLSPQQPLYGLQPSGLDGRRPLDRGIDEMADRYLRAIRRIRPHGPYLLAGRCNGATVAYELGQRLLAAGEEVPLLVSLDSDPPPAGPTELEPGVPYDPMMEAAWIRARDEGESVPDLDAPDGPPALAGWLRQPVGPAISRYLREAWHWRWDLRRNWPDPLGADAPAFAQWAWEHGIEEMGLAPRLLAPAPAANCRLPDGRAWDWAMAIAWSERGHTPADVLSHDGWAGLREQLTGEHEDGMNAYLLAASQRPDLVAVWPDPLGRDRGALLGWAWSTGLVEGLSPDLLPPSPTPISQLQRQVLRARSANRRLLRVRRDASKRAARLREEARARALETIERQLDRPLPGARERVERRVVAAARRARATYRAQPWPGKIVLVTSAEFEDKPPYIAWPTRALAGFERRHLDVGHVEMLREPGAALLARCLEECVAEALGT